MLIRHSLHRLAGLTGGAALAAVLLVGAGATEPRPVAAQGLPQALDLTVALMVSPTTVQPQEKTLLEATARFRNGPIGITPKYAFNVVLDVQAPAGSTVHGTLPDGQTPMTCSTTSATAVRCQIPQISDHDPVTAAVSFSAPAMTGTHTATAQVDPQHTVQEFAEGNNSASATLRVRRLLTLADAGLADSPLLRDRVVRADVSANPPVLRLPDLTIQRVSPAQQHITGGQTADVEFAVQNIGDGNAQGVVVQSNVPFGLAIQSANLSGNACSATGNTWTCTLDLPAGGPPVSLGLRVTPMLVVAGETILNGITAEIDAPHAIFERDESNNTATAIVAVP
jgi:hypothetical protein